MASRVTVTARFLLDVGRDVLGTLRGRWRRFRQRAVDGDTTAAVGVDIYPFFERMTGVGWYEWNLLGALARRDDGLLYNLYGRTFLAASDPPAPELPWGDRMRLRVHQLPPGFLLPERLTLGLLRTVAEPLLRILDGNDVLFAPNFFIHADQAPYGRSTVATVHDLAFKALPHTVAPATLAELRRHLPDTLFHADRLVAVSDATSRDLVEHLGVRARQVHTVHEGLDPIFEEAPSDPRPEGLPERYLLFVSTLEPRKNVVGLLKAFRLIAEWGYPGALVLAGRWGWRTEAIQSELEGSPVRERIVLLDYVERAQLPSLYRHADALLLPSWLEGFGLPILEAMAVGVPVVTSGQSSMPEVAGPAGVYVDPASPHGIASGVASLLADPDLRVRLSEVGRRRARSFSWDRAAGATAEILRQSAGLPARDDDEYRVDRR